MEPSLLPFPPTLGFLLALESGSAHEITAEGMAHYDFRLI